MLFSGYVLPRDDEGVDIDAQAYIAQQEAQGVEEGTGMVGIPQRVFGSRGAREFDRDIFILGEGAE